MPVDHNTVPYPQFRFSIDRGGTFTDVIAHVQTDPHTTKVELLKLLSQDPDHYPDAPSEGIRRILRRYVPDTVAATGAIDITHLLEVRMGTTVATNALLEHNGERCAMVLTEGFGDILDIRDQARPKIFNLNIRKSKTLPELTVEAKERIRPVSLKEQQLYPSKAVWPASWRQCGDSFVVDVVAELDLSDMRAKLQATYDTGVCSVAICLLHAYAYAAHERQVKALAEEVGFTHISVSSELMALLKYVPRSITASVDAYLSPLILHYIVSFKRNFSRLLDGVRLYFIQSDGGLTSADTFYGYRAVLSGPAGGVVGCSRSAALDLGPAAQVVGFDMGGTSTDVSRCEGDKVEHVVEAEISGTPLQAPQVRVHTVAAGGGSMLKFENGMFHVGPESAGAHPGPACYGKGGPLAVTDANLVLGHLCADYFPRVFGLKADQPLDKQASTAAFQAMAKVIAAETGRAMSVEEIAFAFVTVANEAMCRPIRNITEASGHRCSHHALSVFGGAGGQHAGAMARSLGMNRILVCQKASILSAVGISMTDVVEEQMTSVRLPLRAGGADLEAAAGAAFTELRAAARQQLARLDFDDDHIQYEHFLSMQYEGTNHSLMVAEDRERAAEALELLGRADTYANRAEALFLRLYRQQYGFVLEKRGIVVDGIRVRARGTTRAAAEIAADEAQQTNAKTTQAPYSEVEKATPLPIAQTACYFSSGWEQVPVYAVAPTNGPIDGPALLILEGTSILVEHQSTAYTNDRGNLIIHTAQVTEQFTTELLPLPLSIFSHRFMSIAEQMGNALQRTSISTNIKERLDFSCAIFDPDGNLVANAPHIPVHLGAMGAAVRWQRDHYGDAWRPGDVVLTNHPACGGSHLPDITVISAHFHEGRIVFYVASRGHHADVGGSTPGSMPPFSKSLAEEGAAIKTIKLVREGVFNEEGIREALLEPGKTPGLSGSRQLEDSISDLRAQVAANNRGIQLLDGLVATYGLDVVQAFMGHIQTAAERAAREVLKQVAVAYGSELDAVDYMDDGTPIKLHVSIRADGGAVFDFSGSGSQVLNSSNCPTAVVHSAIIYCVRCLVDSDIPLNQGCMKPITTIVEPGSILRPDEDLPVVAGNVLTSQRVTDVVLSALRAVACAHGCMNNFTFGAEDFAYYETICGGAGAGATFHGASAVHTHMTNTRLTDPEILETRYPVLLRVFRIRRGSGGAGRYRGGDGVVRSLLVLQPMTAVVLTERRVLAPPGLYGGGAGARGLNMLYVAPEQLRGGWCTPQRMLDDARRGAWLTEEATGETTTGGYRKRNIGGKNIVKVEVGDIITIHTGGGGACYPPDEA
ncbi:5-oxoprolinase (ATP-hydrolysing) [Strigomonas culicis]|uniref:5-oxoprolinase (ATP-hydrolysing) n=1 Tax=Strigomonas culicis TaxID=28005 RepID=S9VE91_9TRYP|nr:5-oxoprolinase (ATP-hydrolysing) [Strigomonas culicis]|eukprot:EPY21440.1 5-oxoprolinase (ATP-hydrolysing) [Strigomonas culicis]